MRILHTADWHLGKQLHGVSLLEDQASILDQICRIAVEQKPDAIIVAGDLYDRAVPPPEAVTLLDATFARLLKEVGVPLLVIAGNHDGPERLSVYSGLLSASGLHIAGVYDPTLKPVRIAHADGDVDFHLLPFLEPAKVRVALQNESISGHEGATEAALAASKKHIESAGAEVRHVLISHAFVSGGRESESERPLAVGNAGTVSCDVFEGFDYVALGHLHAPQQVKRAEVRYSGSPLKYSFSEITHQKSVSMVELGSGDEVKIDEVLLVPKKDLRKIEGTFDELIAAAPNDPDRTDYILASLTDKEVVLNAMGRLREVYPNTLQIETAFRKSVQGEGGLTREDLKQDDLSLFRSFYCYITDEELSDEQADEFSEVAQKITNGEEMV